MCVLGVFYYRIQLIQSTIALVLKCIIPVPCLKFLIPNSQAEVIFEAPRQVQS